MKIAALALLLLVSPTELELGREILAKDPRSAIAHFERVDSREGREWLAVALMMESRAPSDEYVERAFASAIRARVDHPEQAPARAAMAAALRPGDLVITSLVGETDAYAWAFDHDAFIGYQLPPPATIATAVQRIRAYAGAKDSAGVTRIADDFLPALFGPAFERLPKLTRVVLAGDGPLSQLPLDALSPSLPPGLIVSTASYASLVDTINTPSPAPESTMNHPVVIALIVLAIVASAVFVSRRARRRSPGPS